MTTLVEVPVTFSVLVPDDAADLDKAGLHVVEELLKHADTRVVSVTAKVSKLVFSRD